MSGDKSIKRVGKRPGRKPSKIDFKAKLERSRQSARECRARKKLRYQYLEELVAHREKAIYSLRDELNSYKNWCIQVDNGIVPENLIKLLSGQHGSNFEERTPQTSYPVDRPPVTQLSSRGNNSNPSVTRASSFPEQRSVGNAFTRASSFPETEQVVYSNAPQNAVHPHGSYSGSAQSLSSSYGHFSNNSMIGSFFEGNNTGTNQNCGIVRAGQSSGFHFIPNTSSFPTSSVSHSVPVTSSSEATSDTSGFQDAFDILSKLEATGSSRFVSTCMSNTPYSYRNLLSASESSFSNRPSSSSGAKGQDTQPSWYSILTELEPQLSRQGAESTSGTPTMGTPKLAEDDVSLPTVLCDLLDSTDSSDG